MKNTSKATILFVDDDPCMCEVMAMILGEEGFEVSTATDGFDALAQLRSSVPDLIISDLQMPRMSGAEFLSVIRLRFPAIPVIAISGAYHASEYAPEEVMADAFFPKSRCHPDELTRTVRELMYSKLARPTNYHPCHPPQVQTVRNGEDRNGNPTLLLTCTECLRAFACTEAGNSQGVMQAYCQFCRAPLNFVPPFSVPLSHAGIDPCDAASASVS